MSTIERSCSIHMNASLYEPPPHVTRPSPSILARIVVLLKAAIPTLVENSTWGIHEAFTECNAQKEDYEFLSTWSSSHVYFMWCLTIAFKPRETAITPPPGPPAHVKLPEKNVEERVRHYALQKRREGDFRGRIDSRARSYIYFCWVVHGGLELQEDHTVDETIRALNNIKLQPYPAQNRVPPWVVSGSMPPVARPLAGDPVGPQLAARRSALDHDCGREGCASASVLFGNKTSRFDVTEEAPRKGSALSHLFESVQGERQTRTVYRKSHSMASIHRKTSVQTIPRARSRRHGIPLFDASSDLDYSKHNSNSASVVGNTTSDQSSEKAPTEVKSAPATSASSAVHPSKTLPIPVVESRSDYTQPGETSRNSDDMDMDLGETDFYSIDIDDFNTRGDEAVEDSDYDIIRHSDAYDGFDRVR